MGKLYPYKYAYYYRVSVTMISIWCHSGQSKNLETVISDAAISVTL